MATFDRIRRKAKSVGKQAPKRLLRPMPAFALSWLGQNALAVAKRKEGVAPFASPVLVGTFHKSGTVLMDKIFRRFCIATGCEIWSSNRPRRAPDGWSVCLNYHSAFEDAGLDPRGYRTLIVIRDPRDIIVSAMNYHLNSGEPWLHEARPELDGMTYQQALHSREDKQERYRFELANASARTIEKMLRTRRNPAYRDALFVRLEDLVSDHSLAQYDAIFRHLGVHSGYLPVALSLAYENSLFNTATNHGDHVRSGKSARWKSELDAETLDMFHRRFPDALEVLGYPADGEISALKG